MLLIMSSSSLLFSHVIAMRSVVIQKYFSYGKWDDPYKFYLVFCFLFQKRQSRRGDYRQYSPKTLHTALSKILNKNMTVYKASEVYGIPKSTLLDRVAGRVGVDVVMSGPAPTLVIYSSPFIKK